MIAPATGLAAVLPAGKVTAPAPPAPLGPPARKAISPFYANYLEQQAAAIRLKGGTDDDVRQFAALEKGAPLFRHPNIVSVDQLTDVPPYLQGVSMAVLQGATFGWGDEAIGWYRSRLTGQGARESIDAYRKEYAAWADKYGHGQQFMLELDGGLLTGGVGAGAEATAGRLVGTAAGAGAVAGAGYADGDVGDRTMGALFGATLGAVTAGLAVGLGKVLKPIARPIAEKVTPKPVAALLSVTPEARARERLARALQSDGITSSDLAAHRAIALQGTGVPATIAEVGGDAVESLLGDAAKMVSPVKTAAREAFRQRQEETGQRLMGGLVARMFGRDRFGSANAYEVQEQMMRDGLEAVKPLYTDAYQQTVELTPRLVSLLERFPKLRDAFNRAAARADGIDSAIEGQTARGVSATFTPGLRVERLPEDLGISPAALMKKFPGLTPDKAQAMAGKAALPTTVPLRAIDLMKHELDDAITTEVANRFQPQTARQLKQLVAEHGKVLLEHRDEFVATARSQVASYDKALTTYAGAREAHDAVTLGVDLFRKTPTQIAREIAALPPSQRDFYRLGAVQAFYEKVTAKDAGSLNLARDFFGGQLYARNAQGTPLSLQAQRIHALFPGAPAVADDFLRSASGEALASYRTGRILRRPAAGAAQAAEKLAEGDVLTVRMSPLLTAGSAALQAVRRLRGQLSQDEADEIMHLATKGLEHPTDLTALTDALFARHPVRGAVRKLKIPERGAAVVGGALGQFAGSQQQ